MNLNLIKNIGPKTEKILNKIINKKNYKINVNY